MPAGNKPKKNPLSSRHPNLIRGQMQFLNPSGIIQISEAKIQQAQSESKCTIRVHPLSLSPIHFLSNSNPKRQKDGKIV
jgi:hypothetical protein